MLENNYDPTPVDTSDVVLPKELMALIEKIAENVHDVWAVGRISEGWTYGPFKDPEKKTTPLLVAYDDLPDSEKEYDRNTALETLKLIVKLEDIEGIRNREDTHFAHSSGCQKKIPM